jgi:hypothetical protein
VSGASQTFRKFIPLETTYPKEEKNYNLFSARGDKSKVIIILNALFWKEKINKSNKLIQYLGHKSQ